MTTLELCHLRQSDAAMQVGSESDIADLRSCAFVQNAHISVLFRIGVPLFYLKSQSDVKDPVDGPLILDPQSCKDPGRLWTTLFILLCLLSSPQLQGSSAWLLLNCSLRHARIRRLVTLNCTRRYPTIADWLIANRKNVLSFFSVQCMHDFDALCLE